MRKSATLPVQLMLFTIVFTYALSLIPGGIEMGPIETKDVDLFIDIRTDEYFEMQESETDALRYEDYDFSNIQTAGFLMFGGSEKDESDAATGPVPAGVNMKDVSITGNKASMSKFYAALKQAGTQKVRIAHYGDSAIEGDNITADIRENFQNKFGGHGAGFLSITSQDISFRFTTTHSFADSWRPYYIAQRASRRVPSGISGAVAVPQLPSAWVEYEASRRYKTTRSFEQAYLFYGHANGGQVTYQYDGGKKEKLQLVSGKSVQRAVLPHSGEAKTIRIEAGAKDQAHFYGVSLESGPGVYIDNFPLRGNDGSSLRDIPLENLKEFNDYQDYKLIILSFGLNVLDKPKAALKLYEKEMIETINHLKKGIPTAAILLVGVADRGQKQGSRFVSHANLKMLRGIQENVVRETGVAFWDLFEAMGGENSMAEWVDKGWATKDYVHMTSIGYKKLAEMLYESIMQDYR